MVPVLTMCASLLYVLSSQAHLMMQVFSAWSCGQMQSMLTVLTDEQIHVQKGKGPN